MAPIDIVISIINRHKRETEAEKAAAEVNVNRIYYTGRSDAYTELVNELEGFKKLFN